MTILINFLPILIFIILYVGSGAYFFAKGVEDAFYQLSPTVAILPAIMMGWALHKGSTRDTMQRFLDGVRHRDIITMCIVFLLAGAFSVVTTAIGSAEATVNLALSLIPAHFLLVGVFIAAAFISMAIGTSMGTIATLAPIAVGLGQQGAFPLPLGMATVVGGAMFGDNLSLISDTTIAAVMSQEADMRAKLKINALIALIASVITIGVLLLVHNQIIVLEAKPYSLILIFPFLFLLTLSIMGVNVFIALVSSIMAAGAIGMSQADYSLLHFSRDIAKGFNSMFEIMLLSMLVGGLSGLMGKGSLALAEKLAGLARKGMSKKTAQLIIAKIVSIFDILLANNTVAIIFSGEIARDIARKNRIPPHYSAAWLDIFSCVFQGILPYGAQILMASKIANISPLELFPQVHYCYVLFGVAVGFIVLRREKEVKNRG